MSTVFTIGHSTRSLAEFVALLERDDVRHLADVRRFPMSRRHPHFNGDALAASLVERGIGYAHHPDLGGRRKPRPDSPNAAWRNEAFRGYADYMQSPEFERALADLLVVTRRTPVAVMCAEAVPWRCHRSLLADALIARGDTVLDILDAGTRPHALPRFAVVDGERVTYPAHPENVDTVAPSQHDLFGR